MLLKWGLGDQQSFEDLHDTEGKDAFSAPCSMELKIIHTGCTCSRAQVDARLATEEVVSPGGRKASTS